MTIEEAREQLIKLQHQIYKNWGGDIELDADDHYEALDYAIEVIGRGVPRKAIDEHCPACEWFLVTRSGRKMKYCSNCGQAIDWSTGEE